ISGLARGLVDPERKQLEGPLHPHSPHRVRPPTAVHPHLERKQHQGPPPALRQPRRSRCYRPRREADTTARSGAPKPEALDLSGRGLGEGVDVSGPARVLVPGEPLLEERGQLLLEPRARSVPGLEHEEGLRLDEPILVRAPTTDASRTARCPIRTFSISMGE